MLMREFLDDVSARTPWVNQWGLAGMLCVRDPNRIINGEKKPCFEWKAGPDGVVPSGIEAIGCGGWDEAGNLRWVGIDLDVGHGKPEHQYATVADAFSAAAAIRTLVGGAAEIRTSKSGSGLHVRVAIAEGVKNGRENAPKIAKWIARTLNIRCDRAVLGRQNLWFWAKDAVATAFNECEPCAGTWTPPAEAFQDAAPATSTATSPAGAVVVNGGWVVERARKYLREVPPSVSGSGGHDAAFYAACRLVQGFNLPEGDALALLLEWNAGCQPPWSEAELRHKVVDAARAPGGRGYLLNGKTATQPPVPPTPREQEQEQSGNAQEQQEEKAASIWLESRDLLEYDTDDDKNNLLGNRYLCKGSGLLFVGGTGYGKSSALMQAATLWALGEPFFGIAPVRPLRIAIIQAENDRGDMSEQHKGVMNGLNLLDRREELAGMLKFCHMCSLTGESVAKFVRQTVLAFNSDLVILDPLFSYLGGDINSAKDVGHFLRNLLNPIGQETGAAFLIAHHTTKPVKSTADKLSWTGGDFAYIGAGSAEMANWARAVMSIRQEGEGTFELRASKRGTRSGMTGDDQGATAKPSVIYIKHAEQGICWERGETPVNPKIEADRAETAEIISLIPANGMTYTELRQLVMLSRKCESKAAEAYISRKIVQFTKFTYKRYYQK